MADYSGTTETTHYIGGLLEIMTRGASATEYRHQIPTGSGSVVYTRRGDGTTSTYYGTSDHLGSSDLVMDGAANVLARESFTHFGARRGSAWTGTPSTADYTAFGNTTRSGFTGHEMLDSVSLVHMNGRVYDPYLGRFLSPDTVVQSLTATQSINPYAYAWNDPLKYVDPTGHSLLGDLIGVVVGIIVAWALPEYLPEYFAALSASTVAIAGFVGGFVGAYVSTGSLSASLMAGLIAGIAAGLTAGASYEVSTGNWEPAEGVIARIAVGCGAAAASSGNCGKGALSAVFAIAAQPLIVKFPSFGVWGTAPEAVQAGLIGGEAAKLAGGKFDDGFSTSAVQYLAAPPPRSSSDDAGVLAQLVRDANAVAFDIYAVTIGQLGALYVFFRYDLPTVAMDAVGGSIVQALGDLGKTFYDLLLPHYGYYGGAGWGVGRTFGNGSPAPLNQVDAASYQHDLSYAPPGCGGASAV